MLTPSLEALFDEGEYSHALFPAREERVLGEAVIGEEVIPSRLGLALILAARRNVLAQLIDLLGHLRVAGRLFRLQLQLLKNQIAIDKSLDSASRGELRPVVIRVECLKPQLFVHIAVEDQIVVHDRNHCDRAGVPGTRGIIDGVAGASRLEP